MISVCFTTYNRTELLWKAFKDILSHPFVNEIVIVDDASDKVDTAKFLQSVLPADDCAKVKLFRNAMNLDCYRNKREAISKASNEWVCILDSDNQFDKTFIDRLENLWIAGLNRKTVYHPSFAKPHFDFRKYESFLIDKSNVGKYMVDATFSTMLNAFNYFVNRDEYLRVWDGSIDPVTSDSIYHNLNWLKAGNNFYVVPGLEYTHRVEDHGKEEESHYKKNVRRTERGLHQRIEQELKTLNG
jgi:glycosyltransferase involved in cell wall biosynthesis